jgi:hypothetical protein
MGQTLVLGTEGPATAPCDVTEWLSSAHTRSLDSQCMPGQPVLTCYVLTSSPSQQQAKVVASVYVLGARSCRLPVGIGYIVDALPGRPDILKGTGLSQDRVWGLSGPKRSSVWRGTGYDVYCRLRSASPVGQTPSRAQGCQAGIAI